VVNNPKKLEEFMLKNLKELMKSIGNLVPDCETIRSITPIFLALMGAGIAITAIVHKDISPGKLTSALGFAGTAISGAAGLAQPSSSESDSDSEE
jgi:hypothetical protein